MFHWVPDNSPNPYIYIYIFYCTVYVVIYVYMCKYILYIMFFPIIYMQLSDHFETIAQIQDGQVLNRETPQRPRGRERN